jgi:uracil-DNA glycosylase
MPHEFDPGSAGPYDQLFRNYPDETVFPYKAFRTEWGPVFYRGRLDGTARVLAIGQDPAQSETIARRILVGTAGHRFQGFLAKLGIDRSYLMINTFLYSVYGQQGGTRHQKDPKIATYRNQWLDTIFSNNAIEAVIALGSLADGAWQKWKLTSRGKTVDAAYAHIKHPTEPISASKGNKKKLTQLTKAMLQNWNAALTTLKPHVRHPDAVRPLVLYGDHFLKSELVEIPEADMPVGTPPWMRRAGGWAKRAGSGAALKRATIVTTVPAAFRN